LGWLSPPAPLTRPFYQGMERCQGCVPTFVTDWKSASWKGCQEKVKGCFWAKVEISANRSLFSHAFDGLVVGCSRNVRIYRNLELAISAA